MSMVQPMPYPAVVSDPGDGGNPAFVGSKTATYTSTAAQTISLTDLRDTNNEVATLAEGDLVLVCYVQASGQLGGKTLAEATPTGYTAAHADIIEGLDTGHTSMAVTYKFMGATPDSSLTAPGTNDTQYTTAITIMAFRGVDPDTPFEADPPTANGANTGRPDPPAITPATTGAWIVGCHGSAANIHVGAVHTNSGDYSTVTNQFKCAYRAHNFDATSSIGIKTDWTSGEFDAAQLGGSTDTSCSWAAVSLAMRGAPL